MRGRRVIVAPRFLSRSLCFILLSLDFDPHDPPRQVWDGKWPGEADCGRLGFFVNDDPAFPDLNRLFTECVWDADTGRWERKQASSIQPFMPAAGKSPGW